MILKDAQWHKNGPTKVTSWTMLPVIPQRLKLDLGAVGAVIMTIQYFYWIGHKISDF